MTHHSRSTWNHLARTGLSVRNAASWCTIRCAARPARCHLPLEPFARVLQGALERSGVGDDDLVEIELDQTALAEHLEHSIALLAVGAHHLADVGGGRLDSNAAAGFGLPVLVDELVERLHDAVGELFEGEVERLLVQPADALAQYLHHPPEDLGVLGGKGVKVTVSDRQHLGLVDRLDRGGALAAVEQGELTEDLPRPQYADDLLLPVLRLLVDLRAPRQDHVELVGSIPLKEHHGVRLEALSLGDAAQLFELSNAGPPEDGDLRELFHVRLQRCVGLCPKAPTSAPGERHVIARTTGEASTAIAARRLRLTPAGFAVRHRRLAR